MSRVQPGTEEWMSFLGAERSAAWLTVFQGPYKSTFPGCAPAWLTLWVDSGR